MVVISILMTGLSKHILERDMHRTPSVPMRFIFVLCLLFLIATTMLPAIAQQALGFTITYGGRTYDSINDQTTFTYIVAGTGAPPDLSHFDLEIPICPTELVVAGYSPTAAVSFGVDPTTGINGIKWDVPLLTTDTRTYSITFEGNVVEGTVLAAVKGGPGFEAISVPGPSCSNPSISIQKFVSIDGGITWQDASVAPGPDADLGGQVSFRFLVSNDGDVPLSNLTLSDSVFDTGSCALPATLSPGSFFECTIGPFAVVSGQHVNEATATGDYEGAIVSAMDRAHYFGGDRPSIRVEKSISVDGGSNWNTAHSVPGPALEVDTNVWFRFVVTNDGNRPLTDIVLSDSVFETASCILPVSMQPAETSTCVIGPFSVEEGQHVNTVNVEAMFSGVSVADGDTAHYVGETAEELPVIIVIEGPVVAINVNIITIFNINVVVDPDDPILTSIRIGDRIRVEGELITDGDTYEFVVGGSDVTIVIVAINIVIINVEVRPDPQPPTLTGDCSNPPPPWAPAHGWRARCDPDYSGYTGVPPGGGPPGGPGRGRGRP